MNYYKTHEIAVKNDIGTNTTFELYQELASAPSSVGYLPVVNRNEEIVDEINEDAIGVMNSRYVLHLISGPTRDFYSIFNDADPQSVYLKILIDDQLHFLGFLEPKLLDREYGKENEDSIITGEFFSGFASIAKVPIYPEFLESIMSVTGVTSETLISYDLLFSGLFETVCKYGNKFIYAWDWQAENWRENAISPIAWNMFLDMRFKFSNYKEDDDKAGRLLGDILNDICRTFALRIGYSTSKNACLVVDVTKGYTGTSFSGHEMDNSTWTGGFPRIAQSSQTTIALQSFTDSDIRKVRNPNTNKLPRYSLISNSAKDFPSSLYPSSGLFATIEVANPTVSRPYLLQGYQYGTIPFIPDKNVLNSGLEVITEEEPSISGESMGWVRNVAIPEIDDLDLPVHGLLAYILGGWRFKERAKWSGSVKKVMDPMLPITFNSKVWHVVKRSINPRTCISTLDLIELSWQDPF
jgi:hypothetical protein